MTQSTNSILIVQQFYLANSCRPLDDQYQHTYSSRPTQGEFEIYEEESIFDTTKKNIFNAGISLFVTTYLNEQDELIATQSYSLKDKSLPEMRKILDEESKEASFLFCKNCNTFLIHKICKVKNFISP